ncbi:PSD1 and planctomycete cytochrome C domain-containing protein [Pedobacter nyackensis]|uniref:PSD1 and planctomycete cytochrome C domain-containing protein n=1 Tax=Pedobacter nyackensis TaxID=475255 RepID=UPI002930C790|nr:PSD1 and planctomycete cytochrome C domain-containing protein [Pedobacter nyackensis]
MYRRLFCLMLAFVGILYVIQACNSSGDQVVEEEVPDNISYNFHVRPILSDKCFICHGPDANKREAGLRLDIEEAAYKALKEKPSAHALVPFKPLLSEVFLRISSKDSALIMPPKSSNLKLSAHEISVIEKWIKQGAKYERHWAFTPPVKPNVPKVKNEEWTKNEIDHFILQKLEQKRVEPNPQADKERILKRVSLDLTGLPPSIEMMDKFLADGSSNAYAKVVESLLQSPAYGEKMALHWLDVSRYADSHGYQDDNYRSQWPWRDWVIHAFNKNIPYDQFITWQLAGDLMPNATKEQLLATGFNRNHKITEEGGVIDEEYRVEYVSDRTNTFGKALLGVTLECAHCHDHKYDPFSQKEYYQVYAFFNNVKEVGLESSVGGPETYAKKPLMEISNQDIKKILSFVNKQDTNKLIVSVMGDQDTLRKTYILNRGVYDDHGTEVEAGTPQSVLSFSKEYAKNRLGLSKWLFDKKNPLTSRVFVNQVWQEFFGRGIVKTSGDFGMQGELPSHPELLDWLAVDFMNHGWDIKRLVKQIVSSATYQQSAVVSAEKLKTDPENILLSRAPRYRIPAESVRDVVLASSGLLVKTIGGPSVKPYQPAGLWEAATSGRGILANYKQDSGNSLYRRGMYTFIKRTVPPPTMAIFDASNRDQCEVKRLNTNTPLQALVMMNDPAVLEASRVLAARLLKENTSAEAKLVKGFRMIVCRNPNEKEVQLLNSYYADQLKVFQQKSKAEKALAVGQYPLPDKIDKRSLAAMMQVITTIYNLEETITKT